MRIEINDLNVNVGKKVWVTVYKWESCENTNPERHIEPSQAIITHNDKPRWGEPKYLLMKMKKNGEPSRTKIALSSSASSNEGHINIFDNEDECIQQYIKDIAVVRKNVEDYIEGQKYKLDIVDSKKVGFDIISESSVENQKQKVKKCVDDELTMCLEHYNCESSIKSIDDVNLEKETISVTFEYNVVESDDYVGLSVY